MTCTDTPLYVAGIPRRVCRCHPDLWWQPITSQPTKPCTDCDGTGRTYRSPLASMPGECQLCGGMGVVGTAPEVDAA